MQPPQGSWGSPSFHLGYKKTLKPYGTDGPPLPIPQDRRKWLLPGGPASVSPQRLALSGRGPFSCVRLQMPVELSWGLAVHATQLAKETLQPRSGQSVVLDRVDPEVGRCGEPYGRGRRTKTSQVSVRPSERVPQCPVMLGCASP